MTKRNLKKKTKSEKGSNDVYIHALRTLFASKVVWGACATEEKNQVDDTTGSKHKNDDDKNDKNIEKKRALFKLPHENAVVNLLTLTGTYVIRESIWK